MDELTIRGGGSTAVATDTLFIEAARLTAVARILDGWATRAAGSALRLRELGAHSAADTAGSVQAALSSGSERSSSLGSALVESAEQYGRAEWWSSALWDLGGRLGAGLLGMATPTLLLAGASAAALTLPGLAIARQVVGPERADAALARLLAERGRDILSDPAFGAVVRAAADSTDEYLAGLFRSQGLFALGAAIRAPESADMLLGAAAVVGIFAGGRTLVETPVRVTQVDPAAPGGTRADAGTLPASTASLPARGVGDLADRVPPSTDGEPQIRIERYGSAEDPRWIVYSGGTVDFGVVPRGQPYDFTSNLHAVAESSDFDGLVGLAGDSAAAERAVRAAMDAAGVDAADPVLVVGHSGGGIVAANLAADQDLNVVAGVSFGGPVAHVDTRGTPFLSVEHTEDFVPKTAGAGSPSPARIEVERAVLDPGAEYAEIAPAHAMTTYRGTAELVDASREERVLGFRGIIDELTDGSPATTTYWHAERVPTGISPADAPRAR